MQKVLNYIFPQMEAKMFFLKRKLISWYLKIYEFLLFDNFSIKKFLDLFEKYIKKPNSQIREQKLLSFLNNLCCKSFLKNSANAKKNSQLLIGILQYLKMQGRSENNGYAFYILGEFFSYMNKPNTALKYLKKAYELNPDNISFQASFKIHELMLTPISRLVKRQTPNDLEIAQAQALQEMKRQYLN